MKPAAERREHLKHGTINVGGITMPQWSPPLNGGNTGLGNAGLKGEPIEPQWSPPLNGGNTALKIQAV